MQWNDKQRLTIEKRGKNVLVSAAAGSGKTAVLTERILRLVTDEGEGRVSLKELLVVTFTENAANEMRSRIAKALALAAAAAAEDEGGKGGFAEAQLRQLGSAKIMTFHAFCLTVLRRYFYMTEIDPSFGVADEKRADALREEAMDEMLAAAFADEDEEFRQSFTGFLHCYADARDERKAREKILAVYKFIMTLPKPFAWLEDNVAALAAPRERMAEIPAIYFANREIGYRLRYARNLTEKTGELLSSLGLAGLAAKNAIDLETVSQIERLFLSGDMDGTKAALDGISFEVFSAKKDEKEYYEGVKSLVKLRRDRVKDILKKEIGPVFFARPMSEYADEIAHIAPYARTLEALVKRFAEAYARIKGAEKVIDYSDFEHMALKILEDESVADDYRRKFSHIFIDEYQDSNNVQEYLISRISRGNNVFMVGDVKQSIYGFRNAVPEIFLEKYKRFPTDDEEGNKDLRIDLSKNYRSKSGVIDAVNRLFETVIEDHYSGMDYDESVKLVKGVSYEPEWEGKTYLHLVRKDAGREVFDKDAEGEAALCARIIREAVGKMFFDAKPGVEQARPLKYSDVVILLRSAKGAAEVFRKTLEANGIPAITDRGEGYFETVEIDTFLDLLRAIVNLRRDIPLAAAMCSAVFGFELAELAEIREGSRDGFFYSAFLAYMENGASEALKEKCASAAGRLARWRDEERFMRLDDFLWKLMRESGFYGYVSALPRGAQRAANLRALVDRAADFQKGRVEGLRGFLSFIGRIKMRGGDEQASMLTDGEDVCRIMTIHGSKGAEYPVVLLAGLGKSFSQGGSNDYSLLLHRDAGLSLYWEDPEAHTYKKTLFHSALKLRQEVDERAETIRLLYVAMTRAMDTLHLIGTMGDPDGWAEVYNTGEAAPEIDTDVFGATNYLQLILPTAMKNRGVFNTQVVNSDFAGLDAEHDGPPKSLLSATASAERVCGIRSRNFVRPSGRLVSFICETPLRAQGGGFLNVVRPAGRLVSFSVGRKGQQAFIYPYEGAAGLKSKYSVTELSKDKGREAPVFFMAGGMDESDEDAGLTAAERGTAVHKALELLDFKEAYAHRNDRAWFESFAKGLAGTVFRREKDAAASGAAAGAGAMQNPAGSDLLARAAADILQKFAGSDLLARAAASAFLIKEAPFNMKVPYRETVRGKDDENAPDEEIVVQGVIDCLFTEGDGLVIADYKTGGFDVASYDREAERMRSVYGEQLRLYRRAAELIFEKPVTDCMIYMADAGVTVDIK